LPIQAPLARAASNVEKWATGAWAALGGSLELMSGLVVLFFLGVYGAADPESYARIALWFAPASRRARMRHVLAETIGNLQRWLVGRLIAMLFVAVCCAVVFTLLQLPLALPLALLAGLLTFVEYVGAVASGIPPILLAFSQGPTRALEVLIFFSALHVIEGYVLTPLLARTTVHLPPASTLATQVVLATLLGPLGLTFATPLLVVAVTTAQEWSKAPERAPARLSA
jgi:predicted PurR-regulated permease PerM